MEGDASSAAQPSTVERVALERLYARATASDACAALLLHCTAVALSLVLVNGIHNMKVSSPSTGFVHIQ